MRKLTPILINSYVLDKYRTEPAYLLAELLRAGHTNKHLSTDSFKSAGTRPEGIPRVLLVTESGFLIDVMAKARKMLESPLAHPDNLDADIQRMEEALDELRKTQDILQNRNFP